MTTDVDFHTQRLATLRSDRTQFEMQWQESAKRVDPASKNLFLDGAQIPGAKNTEDQYDATASLAKKRFAAVIESLSTPQGSTWHRLVPTDKRLKRNRRVRMYLDDVNELLFSMRYNYAAGFVGNVQQVYDSIGGYGNGTLFVDRDPARNGLRYKALHLAETFYVENHQGVVDTLYRPFRLTPLQALQQFGDKTPEPVKSAAAQGSTRDGHNSKKEFLHVITPRTDYNPGRLDSGGMRYQSCYIYVEQKMVVTEGGYRSFPAAISRYTQTSGEIYGRGPAQWVLPAIKLLNAEKKVFIEQGHKAIHPVLLAFDDGVMNTVSQRPGATNWGGLSADGKRLIDVLPSGNVSLNEKMMEMERAVINDAFLITLFQILTENPQMTATEVLERTREKGILIAPTAGRMQAEFLGPMINRELDVLQQMGLLPPPPAELVQAGGQFEIEYDSPMSRMQRAEKAAGFMRSVNRAAEYTKMTGDPAPLDWFDFDTAMPELMDIDGAPAAWTASPDAVKAKRDQRAQQAQQQQMIDAAPAMASLAKGAIGGKGSNAPPAGVPQ